MMHEPAAERRIACDVAAEVETTRIESDGHLDGTSLLLAHHRFEGEQPLQDLAALAVDIPQGRANLNMGVGIVRFWDEVDKPRFALQGGDERNRFAANNLRYERLGRWPRGPCRDRPRKNRGRRFLAILLF